MSAQVLEGDLGEVLGEALSEALVGLPAEVKVVASETDNVVPLEELAMRTLHRIYHHRPTGGELCTQMQYVHSMYLYVGVQRITKLTVLIISRFLRHGSGHFFKKVTVAVKLFHADGEIFTINPRNTCVPNRGGRTVQTVTPLPVCNIFGQLCLINSLIPPSTAASCSGISKAEHFACPGFLSCSDLVEFCASTMGK